MTVRLAIVFYSSYGTNHRMAQIAADAAAAAGAEVRLRRVAETAPAEAVNSQDAWRMAAAAQADVPVVTHEDMEWANACLFATPTRFGAAASQMRAFLDTLGGLWFQGKLADKAISVMASAQNPHGGQETTVLGLYATFMHWGAVIVPPGYSDPSIFAAGGNPYGYTHTQGKPFGEAETAAIAHQARRLIAMAGRIAG